VEGCHEMHPTQAELQALATGSGASHRPRNRFLAARQWYSVAHRASWRRIGFAGVWFRRDSIRGKSSRSS
jgi:hypothetical protein